MELVAALAEHYKFRYQFYWQPTIFQKQFATNYEQAMTKQQPAGLETFSKAVYAIADERLGNADSNGGLHVLSNIFSQVKDPVFIDWCHIGESGNQRIADEMADDFISHIQSSGNR